MPTYFFAPKSPSANGTMDRPTETHKQAASSFSSVMQNEPLFRCPDCSDQFVTGAQLKNHLRNVHDFVGLAVNTVPPQPTAEQETAMCGMCRKFIPIDAANGDCILRGIPHRIPGANNLPLRFVENHVEEDDGEILSNDESDMLVDGDGSESEESFDEQLENDTNHSGATVDNLVEPVENHVDHQLHTPETPADRSEEGAINLVSVPTNMVPAVEVVPSPQKEMDETVGEDVTAAVHDAAHESLSCAVCGISAKHLNNLTRHLKSKAHLLMVARSGKKDSTEKSREKNGVDGNSEKRPEEAMTDGVGVGGVRNHLDLGAPESLSCAVCGITARDRNNLMRHLKSNIHLRKLVQSDRHKSMEKSPAKNGVDENSEKEPEETMKDDVGVGEVRNHLDLERSFGVIPPVNLPAMNVTGVQEAGERTSGLERTPSSSRSVLSVTTETLNMADGPTKKRHKQAPTGLRSAMEALEHEKKKFKTCNGTGKAVRAPGSADASVSYLTGNESGLVCPQRDQTFKLGAQMEQNMHEIHHLSLESPQRTVSSAADDELMCQICKRFVPKIKSAKHASDCILKKIARKIKGFVKGK